MINPMSSKLIVVKSNWKIRIPNRLFNLNVPNEDPDYQNLIKLYVNSECNIIYYGIIEVNSIRLFKMNGDFFSE